MKGKIAPLLARCVFVRSFIKDPTLPGHLLNVSKFSNFLMELNLISESGPLIITVSAAHSELCNWRSNIYQQNISSRYLWNLESQLQTLRMSISKVLLNMNSIHRILQPLWLEWSPHTHIWIRRLLFSVHLIWRYQKIFVRLDLRSEPGHTWNIREW